MESDIKTITISNLMSLKDDGLLTVNHEYQRGPVWTVDQQRKLVDSVLRGYTLPLIYLLVRERKTHDLDGECKIIKKYEIIDGQQRIMSLFNYRNCIFKLFDPKKGDKKSRFPKFITDQVCAWADRDYEGLTHELRDRFDSTELAYVCVNTKNENETRDLFIRLQSGAPLNDQEKRDAWPGGYTEFVLRFAGGVNKNKPGHPFFQKWVKKVPKKKNDEGEIKDRGESRKLCAGLGMLYFKNDAIGNWVDLKAQSIDDFYYQNLDLDMGDQKVIRFEKLLTLACECLEGYKGKPLDNHEVYHIILLLDRLDGDYATGWVPKFQTEFDKFRKKVLDARRSQSGEYFHKYAYLVSGNGSNAASKLRISHCFFMEKMFKALKPILKDKNRTFSKLQREILFYRFGQKCQICGESLEWDDMDIHHIDQHQHGGKTDLDNGVPVHKLCHPKGRSAIKFKQETEKCKKVVKKR